MSKQFYLDLIERVVWTFIQAFLGVWIVTRQFDATTLGVAAMAGAISVAKCLLGLKVGTETAQALPGVTTNYTYGK